MNTKSDNPDSTESVFDIVDQEIELLVSNIIEWALDWQVIVGIGSSAIILTFVIVLIHKVRRMMK